jgi:hypothetical protein
MSLPVALPGYLVWNPKAGMPTFAHLSFASAQAEAKRLATLHRGQHFFVLSPEGFAHFPVPEAEWHAVGGGLLAPNYGGPFEHDDAIPF